MHIKYLIKSQRILNIGRRNLLFLGTNLKIKFSQTYFTKKVLVQNTLQRNLHLYELFALVNKLTEFIVIVSTVSRFLNYSRPK